MTIHTTIRPSIEQLFAQWKDAQRQAVDLLEEHDDVPPNEFRSREFLWSAFEDRQDAMRAIQTQVLAQIDATFGPGMGAAIKEMIGGA